MLPKDYSMLILPLVLLPLRDNNNYSNRTMATVTTIIVIIEDLEETLPGEPLLSRGPCLVLQKHSTNNRSISNKCNNNRNLI
jgi:hypothetical protein